MTTSATTPQPTAVRVGRARLRAPRVFRALLMENALRLEDLSEITGIPKGSLSRLSSMNNGAQSTTEQRARRIAEAFNVPLDLLFDTHASTTSSSLRNADKA